jgi:heat shock protein HspQ
MHRTPITSPPFSAEIPLAPISHARFAIGDVVRHRMFDFRGVVFDDLDEPVDHPAISGLFGEYEDGKYPLRREHRH